jgi:predicted TPR repeat methyltransferase
VIKSSTVQHWSEQAIALIEKSLDLDPNQADCYSNLGNIFTALGRLDKAVAACERAIALNPNHVNAHNNLGVLLKAQGQILEAEALSPKHPEARRRLLALVHCTLGESQKAVKIFEEWLEQEPENPVARHMLAACSGREVPPRASDAYVEKIFDDFAGSFDAKLAQLSSALRRWSQRCWRIRASRHRSASMCSMPGVAPGCAVRLLRPMHAGWSASICRGKCSLEHERGTRMTSSSKAS